VQWNRRSFLRYAGVTLAVASLPAATGCAVQAEPPHDDEDDGEAPEELTISSAVSYLRPTDFLEVTFQLANLVVSSDGKWLQRLTNQRGCVILSFPPQHVAEAAFFEHPEKALPAADSRPVRSFLAGASRIAFWVPTSVARIPYDPAALLDLCTQWELSVGANAIHATPPPDSPAAPPPEAARDVVDVARDARKSSADDALAGERQPIVPQPRTRAQLAPLVPAAPTAHETSIELPFRLILSPNRFARFSHVGAIRDPRTRVEMWHTRLVQPDPHLRTVRAVWTRDWAQAPAMDPLFPDTTALATNDPTRAKAYEDRTPEAPSATRTAALAPLQRSLLVHQMTNGARAERVGRTQTFFEPTPARVDRLFLSTLGGYLQTDANWLPRLGRPTGLTEWKHRIALGRDQEVRIAEAGYLWPFGHFASRVRVTERKLQPSNPTTAYLWQRTFIVVHQPLRRYDPMDAAPYRNIVLRSFPFRSVEMKTLTSPDLDEPADPSVFVARAGGKPVLFSATGTDHDGNRIDFRTPIVWLTADPDALQTTMASALSQFHLLAERACATKGQRIAYAPSRHPDDAVLETDTLELGGVIGLDDERRPEGEPPFLPTMTEAAVSLAAARVLGGNGASRVQYHEAYYLHGFDGAANAGELVLRVAADQPPIALDFGRQSDRSGGFVSPSMEITGLSRINGPIAGADHTDAAAGKFNPVKFFAGALAPKLFGAIALSDILALDSLLADAPKLMTRGLDVVEQFFTLGDTLAKQASAIRTDLAPANVETRLTEKLGGALKGASDATIGEIRTAAAAITARAADVGTSASNAATAVGAALDAFASGASDLAVRIDATRAAMQGLVAAAKALTDALNARVAGQEIATLLGTADGVARALKSAAAPVGSVVDDAVIAVEAFVKAGAIARDLQVSFDWVPKLVAWPAGDDALFFPKREDGLKLSVTARAKAAAGRPAGFDVLCSLEQFELRLVAPITVMILSFDRLQFRIEAGKKPEIDVVFGGIKFVGILSFVQTLQEILPLDGFSDPPNVDVTSEGLTAGYTLAIPDVAVGIFSLQNIAIKAGFRIPFIGESLEATFSFCERNNPFLLTVSALGGGGFVGVTLAPDGLRRLEAALEFGASLSVNLGVASGTVTVMGGIYFQYDNAEKKTSLTGYFRLRGEMDVLGLISASVELRMELTTNGEFTKMTGRASIEIEVEVLFFSTTVSVSTEREFCARNGDPTFRQLMEPMASVRPWDEYCAAFAA
jgi:hypothetical protein